mgnify:CR=1 FL=1
MQTDLQVRAFPGQRNSSFRLRCIYKQARAGDNPFPVCIKYTLVKLRGKAQVIGSHNQLSSFFAQFGNDARCTPKVQAPLG